MTTSQTLQSLRLNKPKYLCIAERVREQIHAGAYRRGEKLPRVADWKQELGVSLDTMNKVLTALEQDGLIERRQGSGIYLAQSRPRPATGCIGFLGGNQQSAHDPYWAHLFSGAQSAASEVGMEVLLFDSQVDTFRWEKVDGLITTAIVLSEMRHLVPLTMPVVALLNSLPGVPSVVADESTGVHAAVHHLVSQGHRRIGYLLMQDHFPEAPLRLSAYEGALREAGIEPHSEWVRRLRSRGEVAGSPSFVGIGRNSMRAWLNDGFRQLGCTALLTQNDETALGAIDALRETGFKVPDEISIVGFDGTEVAEYCSPPLTTVVMPLHEIGQRAVELLLQVQQEEGVEPTPHRITLPTQLKVRETTPAPSSL